MNAEVIVPAKNMFLWAGIVGIFALIPLYFLIKKGLYTNKTDFRSAGDQALSVRLRKASNDRNARIRQMI